MAKLRLPILELKAKLERVARNVRANAFLPELRRHASRVFSDCVRLTPVRSVSLIRKAQRKQYKYRVNYIPSVHGEHDPMLIVNDAGEEWLKCNGKWYNAEWHLPDDVYAVYQELSNERDRRLATPMAEFIEARAQARFLYQKTWVQAGASVSVTVLATGDVINADSRRKPAKEPPKAYAQLRGGKDVIAIVVFNPFLESPSRYKAFSRRDILDKAITRDRPAFLEDCRAKFSQLAKVA